MSQTQTQYIKASAKTSDKIRSLYWILKRGAPNKAEVVEMITDRFPIFYSRFLHETEKWANIPYNGMTITQQAIDQIIAALEVEELGSKPFYLVHYNDTNRCRDEGGSYDLFDNAEEAVEYAVEQFQHQPHEDDCCKVSDCVMRLSIEEHRDALLRCLESKGEAIYPLRNSCVDDLDFSRIIKLTVRA